MFHVLPSWFAYSKNGLRDFIAGELHFTGAIIEELFKALPFNPKYSFFFHSLQEKYKKGVELKLKCGKFPRGFGILWPKPVDIKLFFCELITG